MVNKLILEKYGEDSLVFFDTVFRLVEKDISDICFISNNDTGIHIGKVKLPSFIQIYTNDIQLYELVAEAVMNVSFRLMDEFEPNCDNGVLCVQYGIYDNKEGSTKIWVT